MKPAPFFLLLVGCASSVPMRVTDGPLPEIAAIYHHARILTQSDRQPVAEALAIGADGRIVAVGPNAAVLALKNSRTRLVDLKGRLMLPGFIDAHAHLYGDALTRGPRALANIKQAVLDTIAEYNRLGITSIHEPGNADLSSSGITQLGLYRELQREGKLTLRINLMRYPPIPKGEGPGGDDWVRVGGVKLRVDFDMAARRALLLEPYSDDPNTTGEKHTSFDDLVDQMRAAHDAGYQIAVHAIGDRANRMTLDAIEKVSSTLSPTAAAQWRPRIEHAQLIHPDDLRRFSQLRVIASMQPVHCIHDMRWIKQRVGERRFVGAYAWRTLLHSGCVVAFGSDTPVESPDPLLGIYAAVTRQNEQGEPPGGWRPEETLTVEEAIRAYTLDAAYAGFEEHLKGSLEPGKVADFVVLSEDLTKIASPQILKVQVLLTVVQGKEVFQR